MALQSTSWSSGSRRRFRCLFLFCACLIMWCTAADNEVARLLQSSAQTTDDPFADFNRLFANATLQLPDATVSKSGLVLNIAALECYDMQIHALKVHYDTQTINHRRGRQLTLNVAVNFTATCRAHYGYTFPPVFRGDGRVHAYTRHNQFHSRLVLDKALHSQADTAAAIAACTSALDIYDLDFRGGVLARLVELAEKALDDVLEREIEGALCTQLLEKGGPALEQVLRDQVTARIDQAVVDYEAPDVLEDSLQATDVPALVDFQTTRWMQTALTQVNNYLTTIPINEDDLGINLLLRRMVLDRSNVALNLDMDQLLSGDKSVLWDSEGRLTQSKLTLKTLKITGLDSVSRMNPLEWIGNYTLKMPTIVFEAIDFEVHATVQMQASQSEDSLFRQADPDDPLVVTEDIVIRTGIRDVSFSGSFLLALRDEIFSQLTLGSLLDSNYLYECLLTTVWEWNVTNLLVFVGDILEPELTGFVDVGLDRLVSTSAAAAFELYKENFRLAVPGLAQTVVKDYINRDLLPSLSAANAVCPQVQWHATTNALDFRDFLLPPDLAQARGGQGSLPYGDMAYTAYEAMVELFREIDYQTGAAALNSMLIQPLTESQSGQAGTLVFEEDLLSLQFGSPANRTEWWSTLLDEFILEVYDLRIEQLDTFADSPFEIMAPTNEATVVKNQLNVGVAPIVPKNNVPADPHEYDLSLRFRTLLQVVGGPLATRNELEFQISIQSLGLDTDLNLALDPAYLSAFPIEHLTDVPCWIASAESLAVRHFDLALDGLELDVKCLECHAAARQILPAVLQHVRDQDAMDLLRRKLPAALGTWVTSGWFQDWSNEFLHTAATQCPLRNDVFGQRRPALELGFPVLPAESVDTVLFTGLLSTWIGIVVFLEEQRHQSPDTLAHHQQPAFETGVELMDFTNLGESTGLGDMADQALQQARDFLNGLDENAGNDMRINGLVRDLLLDDKQVLQIQLADDASWERGGVLFRLDSVAIRGLDSFESLELLQAVSPQTLFNKLHLTELSVELSLTAGYVNGDQQTLSLDLKVSDLQLDFSLFAGLDVAHLRQLPLRTFFQLRQILPCVLASAVDVQVPHLNLTIGQLDRVAFAGLRPDTLDALQRTVNATLVDFADQILEAIPKFVAGTARELLSDALSSYVASASCPVDTQTKTTSTNLVDLRELLLSPAESQKMGGAGDAPFGELFQTILRYVQDQLLAVDPQTDETRFNEKVVRPVTERQSGRPGDLDWPGDLFDRGGRVNAGGLDATVRLRIYDAFVRNLDTFGPDLHLVQAVSGEAHQLNNSASVGVGQRPIQVGTGVYVELLSDGTAIQNNMKVSLSMEKVQILVHALVKILEGPFVDLPLAALADWHCWLATFPIPLLDARGVREPKTEPSLALLELGATIARLALDIECVDCSGPEMVRLTQLLSEPSAREDATRVANELLEYVKGILGGNYLQLRLDRLVENSQRQCQYNANYGAPEPEFVSFEKVDTSESISFLVVLFLTVFIGLTGLGVILLSVRLMVRWRHRKWLQSLEEEHVRVLWLGQQEQAKREAWMNANSLSLICSPEIPLAIRVFIPCAILGNIALFLSGHLSLGGSVTIVATLAGESYVADNFFDFSMASSAVEIWNAGGKELALLILIFSGIWPYTKSLMTIFLWVCPPKLVSIQRRETVLLWLDTLAKWSVIDIFVLVMTLAAFRVSVQSPNVAFLPDGFYSLDLLVVPKWGLFANMIAQLVSQVSSHFIIHYHRIVASKAMESIQEDVVRDVNDMEVPTHGNNVLEDVFPPPVNLSEQEDHPTTLALHGFSRPHRGEDEKLVARRVVSPGLVVLAIVTVALVVAGCIMPSYQLDVLGIVGLLVESGQEFEQASSSYNLFDTVKLLFDQAAFTGQTGDYIGLGTLSLLLVSTVLFVPLAQTAVLLFLWFRPLASKQRYRTMVLLEILSAWQYAEVFLISIIVASWQLGPVSEYMINAYCGSLHDTFAQMVYYGLIQEKDAQCFRVNTSTNNGFFVLVAGALALALLNTYILKAVRQYQRDATIGNNKSLSSSLKLNSAPAEETAVEDMIATLPPVPVLFTDTFRWTLTQHNHSRHEVSIENDI